MNTTKTWLGWHSALPITREELTGLGVPDAAIEAGEMRGELKSHGPWQIPVSYTALCLSAVYDHSKGYTDTTSKTAHGVRTLSAVRESGHQLEGRVSVNGRRVRGFTDSQLFELPDGKLISVAVIYACR